MFDRRLWFWISSKRKTAPRVTGAHYLESGVLKLKYTAGNLRTRDIDKEIRAYNRRLLQLQSKNEAFKILDTLTRTEVMRGRTDAEIARELNRLQELAKPEKQKW